MAQFYVKWIQIHYWSLFTAVMHTGYNILKRQVEGCEGYPSFAYIGWNNNIVRSSPGQKLSHWHHGKACISKVCISEALPAALLCLWDLKESSSFSVFFFFFVKIHVACVKHLSKVALMTHWNINNSNIC